MKKCKCCGHPILDDELDYLFSPSERKMFRAIKRAGTVGISSSELMDAVYADSVNGGPDTPFYIRRMSTLIRRKLAPHGLTIKAHGGVGARYRLYVCDSSSASSK